MSEGMANIGEVLKEAMERTPRPKEPEQEPVAWMTIDSNGEEDDIWYDNPEGKLLEGWSCKPLYTRPPQRKPLTPEQLNHMAELFVIPPHHVEMVVRTVEAAHNIKE